MASPIIVLAGGTGDLGGRIARELVERGATVRALVRPNASAGATAALVATGVTVVPVEPGDEPGIATACTDAKCVVSALNGLRDVIIDRQEVLLDAAVRAKVPRFIPSDFSLDFTKTDPGGNRNLDLRREFLERAARAPIKLTSILNGAFMDMLGAEMPIIQSKLRRVLYWESADQPLDFTTKDNVAAFTAAAALERDTPRILRIAGDTVSARELAATMSEVTGKRYGTLWAGNLTMLGLMIAAGKRLAPAPTAVFPPWQGMQYTRDMFSGRGKLAPLDSARYPGIAWTRVREHLTHRFAG